MARSRLWDTIILGAGAAGLSAAAELTRAGHQVLIIEARERVGGRILTRRDPAMTVPIELGAEFIHGTPAQIWDIIHAEALGVHDVTGEHWQHHAGKLRKLDDPWGDIERVTGKLDPSRADQTFRAFLQAHARGVPPRIRKLVMAYVEGFNAADADRIGTRSLAAASKAEERIHGDRLFRFVYGYETLIDRIRQQIEAKRCTIRLKNIVLTVRWQRGGIEVQNTAGTIERARTCIVTLPLGVLQQLPGTRGAVAFDPPLPDRKREAIHRIAMGAVTKLVVRFDRPFWESDNRQNLGFVHSVAGSLPTWWTLLPMRAPALVAWSGGPAADRLSRLSDGAVRDAAISSLAGALNQSTRRISRHLRAIHHHDWQADPFSRGAYSYLPVGAIDAPAQLAKPVQETLFFAGEATAKGETGTVHAAIASGKRTAREILRVL